MSPIRKAVLLPAALLLGACTTFPSGIIDSFVPPQAQPVQSQLLPCGEPQQERPPNGTVDTTQRPGYVVPCITEAINAAVGRSTGAPRPTEVRRPKPPRRLR